MHYFFRKHQVNDYISYSGHVSDAAGNVQVLFSGYSLDSAFKMMRTYLKN